MPSFTLKSSYSSTPYLVIGVEELIKKYLHGVTAFDANGVNLLSNTAVIESFIAAAQLEVENRLGIKLIPQEIEETKDFNRDDFSQWGYLRLTYPVVAPIFLKGNLGNQQVIDYPLQWLQSKRTSDGLSYRRIINLVPNGARGVGVPITTNYAGYFPSLGLLGNTIIPNYWNAKYKTGFSKVPMDLVEFIGKLASINVFHIAGDLILGAGIASSSLGIDGLSQSISTTSSATNSGYGARILMYIQDMKSSLPVLEGTYKGILMTAC